MPESGLDRPGLRPFDIPEQLRRWIAVKGEFFMNDALCAVKEHNKNVAIIVPYLVAERIGKKSFHADSR